MDERRAVSGVCEFANANRHSREVLEMLIHGEGRADGAPFGISSSSFYYRRKCLGDELVRLYPGLFESKV